MLYPGRRCPLCASLWLSVPLFCLWRYSCTLAPFGRLYGRFMAFCGVCRLCICRCGLLCGSVAAFYGVGVLCIGYGLKIALRGKYGRFPAVPVVFCAAVGGSVALCGRFRAVGVVLYRLDACGGSVRLCGRNKAPASCTGAREKPPGVGGCSFIYSFSAVRRKWQTEKSKLQVKSYFHPLKLQ